MPAISRKSIRRLGLIVVAALTSATRATAAVDVARGEQLYQGCQDCHSLDSNDVGPMHRGVFGRPAGSVPDYSYSAALKGSGITWDDRTLDKWLADPQALVPGTKMFYHLESPQDRADVIEFLKERAK